MTALRSSGASTSRRRPAIDSTRASTARSAIGWHDATTRIEGPAVTDVAEHFRMRWHAARRVALIELLDGLRSHGAGMTSRLRRSRSRLGERASGAGARNP
jgi:phosphatidylserine/phosphatidylglycerophosphate/cardiolipin synthase-like enzyme